MSPRPNKARAAGLAQAVESDLGQEPVSVRAMALESAMDLAEGWAAVALVFARTAALQDKKTDEEMLAASQENRLEQAYSEYLRTNLVSYRTALRNASGELGQNGRALINTHLESVDIMLASPQLVSLDG